jgi:hypothetical protein
VWQRARNRPRDLKARRPPPPGTDRTGRAGGQQVTRTATRGSDHGEGREGGRGRRVSGRANLRSRRGGGAS